MRKLLLTTLLLAVGAVGLAAGARWWLRSPAGAPVPASPPPTPAGGDEPAWMNEVTAESKLAFRHHTGVPGEFFFPEIMAGGAAMLDYDNDGRLDVYLVNAADVPRAADSAAPTDAGTRPANRLFRQQADGTFGDATAGSGLDDPGYGCGVAVGDVNNDGRVDIYVSNYGPDRLFLNQGGGSFKDITDAAGIDNIHWGASAAMFDYDRDGWLDIVVTNYVDYDRSQPCIDGGGTMDYCNPQLFPGTADRLFRNLGFAQDGGPPRFEDVSVASGIAKTPGAGLGVVCADFNEDRWPDIYVANDGAANRLWLNQRDGTFRDEAILMGAAYDRLGRGQASMGIALGDLNGDLRLDLLLTHLDGESNALYTLGEAGFGERSSQWGLAAASFPYTGFGTAMVDFNLDGWLDLAVVNGRVRRPQSEVGRNTALQSPEQFWLSYGEANQILVGDGKKLRPLESATDDFAKVIETSRALVVGDVDNDGDQDLLVTNIGGPTRLFRNVAPRSGHWLQIRAVQPKWGGRDAYGALITVKAGKRQWRGLMQPGSGYLASHDPRVHFGLGDVDRIDAIQVLWPEGTEELFPGVDADQSITLTFGQGKPAN